MRRLHDEKTSKVVSYLKSTTEEFTGQAEIVRAQAHVRGRRDELQVLRREVAEAASRYDEIQLKLRQVYVKKTQMYQAKQRDLSALQAINTEEGELLLEEQSLAESLDTIKQKERECFEALGNAIVESHEKERTQSERMKYYSRLGSVLGAALGFLGSNIFLRREVRKHHGLQKDQMESVEKSLQGLVDRVATYRQSQEGQMEAVEKSLQELVDRVTKQRELVPEVRQYSKGPTDSLAPDVQEEMMDDMPLENDRLVEDLSQSALVTNFQILFLSCVTFMSVWLTVCGYAQR